MTFIPVSRVLETASGSGTGNLTLQGAVGSGEYDAFNERLSVGDGSFYVIVDGSQFEIGYGTYSAATPNNGTLTRDTVIRSSSGTGKINLSGSTVNVFCDMPPEKVLVEDPTGVVAQVSAILNTVTVQDFATLKTTAIPASGSIIWVRYGVTAGDGKGGTFYWAAGNSDPEDDTAVDLTVNTILSSVSGAGRWIRTRSFLHPEETASATNVPINDIGRLSTNNDLVSNNEDRGVTLIPQVENVAAQASYATFAAFKAAASSKWKQGDLIVVRGVTAEGDIDAPLTGTWQASSTNTTNLDSQFLRPDDISGSNPGRLSFPVPVRAVKFANGDATPSVNATSVFTCADVVSVPITAFDDMKDGQRIIVQPGAQDQTFTHSINFKMPNAHDFILRTTMAPIEFYKENGVISMLHGGPSSVMESFTNYAALKARPFSSFLNGSSVVITQDTGREGIFVRVTSDISAGVTSDPAEAVYIADPSTPSGSAGGFVRLDYLEGKHIMASWFGVSTAASASTNGTAITRWLAFSSGKECEIGSGVFTTNAVFSPGKNTTIYTGGSWAGLRDTWDPASGESQGTVIKGDGTTLTGANSTVGKFSIPAVGTDFADSADDGDELRDVTIIGGIHFDANGAQYAAVYHRIHNFVGVVTHSGAAVAGFGMWGVYEQLQPFRFGTFLNDGVGCLVGVQGPNTSYSADLTVFNIEMYLNSVRNGQGATYVKGSGTDEDGAGFVWAAGRGSKLVFSSEKNFGRTGVIKKCSGLGATDVVQKYAEGNEDGLLIDEYAANYQSLTIKGDFNHPGNGVQNRVYVLSDGATTVYSLTGGAGLAVGAIGVYVAGVKLTPTTQYTVADNGGNLDVTLLSTPTADDVIYIADYSGANKPLDITIIADSTDDGPANSGSWIKIEDMQPHSTTGTGGIAIHSNTYKFRLRDTPRGFVSFTNRNATPEGIYASGFFTWAGTTITKRADADNVGGVTPTYQTAGVVRLMFPPELYVRGPSSVSSNYQLSVFSNGGTLRYHFEPGTYTGGYVEVRCYDLTDAYDISASNPPATQYLKYTLSRIDV